MNTGPITLIPHGRREWLRAGLRVIILLGILGMVGVLGACIMTRMPGKSYSGPLPPLDEQETELSRRLREHVERLAGVIGERNVYYPAELEAAAQYIEESFKAIGYEPVDQTYRVYEQTVRNIAAVRPGARRPEEIVVVGGHYDSVNGSPGANDNATGVAATLEIARLLADSDHDRTIRFLAFVNEEPPFFQSDRMGSRQYARHCRRQNDKIIAMLSLETIGYYTDQRGSQQYPPPFSLFYPKTGNFIGFVGNLASRGLLRRSIASFRRHTRFPSEGAALPEWIPGAGWSDHWAFWREGYPAIMLTDTAPFRYPYYHSAEDTPDKIDYDRTARVVAGLARVVAELAETDNE